MALTHGTGQALALWSLDEISRTHHNRQWFDGAVAAGKTGGKGTMTASRNLHRAGENS
jgi:hypothetical protein